jgi:4-hydroxythreonine-4-phosphate dehydrogenase
MNAVSSPPPIAITMGDPSGIGPEIICKVIAENRDFAQPLLVIGDSGILRRAARVCNLEMDIVPIADPSGACGVSTYRLFVVEPLDPLPVTLPFGKIDARAGRAAYEYLITAIDFALAGQVAAIVTAPLHKEALSLAGVREPGHTEILARCAGVRDVAMMLVNDELRVVLVSIHVPLIKAIELVTFDNELRTIRLAAVACRTLGIKHPRIAVAGLNPHAGEDGLFGRQDVDIIRPAIEAARAGGLDVTGPWPGDTVFMRARRGEFDIVVAQYHDQGLIPVKLMGVDQGVNVTLGLPFVRTSVDHGTAFDIAGTGQADPSSLLQALRCAEGMMVSARELVTA